MVVMRKLPKRVRISFHTPGLTHFGGLFLLQGLVRQVGLPRLLVQAVRFRRWNTVYTISEELLAILYPILLGLGRLETARLLQQNGTFQYLTGLRRYPDTSTLRRFLTRFGQHGLAAFGRLHDRCRHQFLRGRRAIFDLDTTVLTVYGQQQGAAVGCSFQPLLCFEGGSGICWEAQWLPGDAHPLAAATALLERAWVKLPSSVRRVWVRADPAFQSEAFLAFLEGKRAVYTLAARMSRGLQQRLGGLRYHRYGSGLESSAPFRDRSAPGAGGTLAAIAFVHVGGLQLRSGGDQWRVATAERMEGLQRAGHGGVGNSRAQKRLCRRPHSAKRLGSQRSVFPLGAVRLQPAAVVQAVVFACSVEADQHSDPAQPLVVGARPVGEASGPPDAAIATQLSVSGAIPARAAADRTPTSQVALKTCLAPEHINSKTRNSQAYQKCA